MIGIYARVSTEEQAKNGYSLMDQIRQCKKLSDSNDIIEYIDEGISGEVLDRPALSKLRKDIKDGIINKVIILDPDRLSRKLINQLIISEEIEKKASMIFVNGEYQNTPEGRLFYQLRGAISEFEKAKITERMSRGRKEKARQGLVVKDYGIYGYDFDARSQQFIINPFESEIVKLIFTLFTDSSYSVSGISKIAKLLTDKGIPTKKNASLWHRQVIRQILMNKIYIGEFYQNKWNTEGYIFNKYKSTKERISVTKRPLADWIKISCPCIIEKEIFMYAQNLLEESRRRWAGIHKNDYLLSGLLRCGNCGNSMIGRKSKNWGIDILNYTDDKKNSLKKNTGCGRTLRAHDIETTIWNKISRELLDRFTTKNLIDIANNENKNLECFSNRILNIDSGIIKYKKQRQKVVELLIGSNLELDLEVIENLKNKLLEIKTEENYLINTKNQLLSSQNKDNNYENLYKKALIYYLKEEPDKLNFYDKQLLIRNLVKEIIVEQKKLIIKLF